MKGTSRVRSVRTKLTDTPAVDDWVPNSSAVVTLDETREAVRIHSQEKIHEVLRNALFSAPYIRDTADDFLIPDDEMMGLNGSGDLVFILKADYFNDWKVRH